MSAAEGGRMAHWWLRIDDGARFDLTAHLEAADGLAYLEDDGGPGCGRLDVPLTRIDEARAYVTACARELGFTLLDGPPPGATWKGVPARDRV